MTRHAITEVGAPVHYLLDHENVTPVIDSRLRIGVTGVKRNRDERKVIFRIDGRRGTLRVIVERDIIRVAQTKRAVGVQPQLPGRHLLTLRGKGQGRHLGG